MASNHHSSSSPLIFPLVVLTVLTTSTAAVAASSLKSTTSTTSPPAASPKHQWSASPPAEPLSWLPSSQPLKSRRLLHALPPAASSPPRESPANPSPPVPPNLSPQSPESLLPLKSSRWQHASPATETPATPSPKNPVTLVQSPVTLEIPANTMTEETDPVTESIPSPSPLLSSQSLNPATTTMDPPRESLEKISAQLNKIIDAVTLLSSTTVLGKGRQERDMEIMEWIKKIAGLGAVYGLIQLVGHLLKFIAVASDTNQYQRPNESRMYCCYRNLIGGLVTWPTFYDSKAEAAATGPSQAVQHEEIELHY